MNGGDEIAHMMLQLAQSQQQENRFFLWGYIASYDPTRHYVTVLVPKYRDPNSDEAVITPWMPLGSQWVGDGFGMQVAPHGGATSENPAAGEACCVQVIERDVGISIAAHLLYNQVKPPPMPGISAGEAVMQHETGSFIYFKKDGSLAINTATNLTATVGGDLTATVDGNMDATVTGTAKVTAAAAQIVANTIQLCKSLSDALLQLCTSIFATWASTHIHSGGTISGQTGMPTTAPPTGSLTSVVTAE